MLWLTLSRIFSTLLALIHISCLADQDKDLELMILRHQLGVMVRLQSKPVKPNRAEKLILTLLTRKLKKSTRRSIKQLRDFIRIVKPETVIRWHRELVRKKWAYDQVYLAGITSNPDGLWVAQQARQFAWQLEKSSSQFCCLIRDNDSKYTTAFDTVFESQQINVIPTPFQSPNANAIAESWVRTIRHECLDHILIVNEAHLRRVLNEFVDYYNTRRPHQSLSQQSPIPHQDSTGAGSVKQRKIIGGIINDYYRPPLKSLTSHA